MLVISVGLLGILGLFINGLQATDAAYLRSQATVLAYDLADRIRANPSALGSYSLATATTVQSPSNNCSSQTCSTTQLATADLYDWKNQIVTALPAGDASVAIASPNATITVTWDHMGDSQSYSMVMR